jgi:hypothetical protein
LRRSFSDEEISTAMSTHESEPREQRVLDPPSQTSRDIEDEEGDEDEEAAYAGDWLQTPTISSKGSEDYDDFDVNDDGFDKIQQFTTRTNDLSAAKMTNPPSDAVDFGSTTPQHSTYYNMGDGDGISFETNPTVNYSGTVQVNPKLNANPPRQAPPSENNVASMEKQTMTQPQNNTTPFPDSTTTRNIQSISSSRVRWSQDVATPEGKSPLEPEPEPVAKVSPTSVMDLEEDINHNRNPMSAHLAFMMNNNARPPKPTRVETAAYATQSVGRSSYTTSTGQKPKSILRKGRLVRSDYESDCPSDETPIKSVRISDAPPKKGEFIKDSPTAMGFVDNSGRELSPVQRGSKGEVRSQSSENELKGMRDWMSEDGSFARNIPQEYQNQFLGEHGVSRNLSFYHSVVLGNLISQLFSLAR